MGDFRFNDGYWWRQADSGWTYFRNGGWYDTSGNFVVQAEPWVTQQLGQAIGGQAGQAIRNFGRGVLGPGGTYYDRAYRPYGNLNVPGTNLNVPGGWNQGYYRGNTGVGSAIGGAVEGAIRGGGNVQGGGNFGGGSNFGGGLFQ